MKKFVEFTDAYSGEKVAIKADLVEAICKEKDSTGIVLKGQKVSFKESYEEIKAILEEDEAVNFAVADDKINTATTISIEEAKAKSKEVLDKCLNTVYMRLEESGMSVDFIGSVKDSMINSVKGIL